MFEINSVPIKEPSDIIENPYDAEQYPSLAPDYFVMSKDDSFVKTAVNKVKWAFGKLKQLWSYDDSYLAVSAAATGNTEISADGQVRIGAYAAHRPSVISLFSTGYIQLFPALWSTFQGDLKSSPSGQGYDVYADSFHVWSSESNKTDIVDITNPVDKLKSLAPKAYKVANKDAMGLIVENTPSYLVSVTKDEKGNEVKAVKLSSQVALNTEVLKQVLERIENLERASKEVIK
jgi:hypothetical protein